MEYRRTLKRFMSGDDVLYAKQRLLELGYLTSAKKKTYGNDTYNAVKKFQAANDLDIDGVIGKLTWSALFPAPDPESSPEPDPGPTTAVKIPDWFSKNAKVAIGSALASVSDTRKQICLEALQWAIDPLQPLPTLKGFYIRGGNSHNTDLTPNIMTKSKLNAYFKKAKYSQYFDAGRKEMMLEQSEHDGYDKIGSDCSGLVVGIWRKCKIVKSTFDACANALYESSCSKRSGNPVAGDLAWRSGHIGIYVGGGYVVEAAGGAYGIQLTKTSKRQAYDYVNKKLKKLGGWTAYGDPKYFD